jgi:hypothetical protein
MLQPNGRRPVSGRLMDTVFYLHALSVPHRTGGTFRHRRRDSVEGLLDTTRSAIAARTSPDLQSRRGSERELQIWVATGLVRPCLRGSVVLAAERDLHLGWQVTSPVKGSPCTPVPGAGAGSRRRHNVPPSRPHTRRTVPETTCGRQPVPKSQEQVTPFTCGHIVDRKEWTPAR